MKITKSNSMGRFFYQALLTSILFMVLILSTTGCERDNDPYETEEEYCSDSTHMDSTGGRVVSLNDSLDGDYPDDDHCDDDDDDDDGEDDDDYDDDSDSTGLGG